VLNTVIAEIRLPENKAKDTHNLGKTTIGKLLDFCFLQGKDQNFFIFKHLDRFKDFVFYLEIELADASFLTVRRGVEEATRISFKKHEASHQDFSVLSESGWDHFELPFERAKEMLDSLLDWRALKPWSYRKIIGYLLRSQDDYGDVFQLKKFAAAHADWKPFLAQILGFNAKLIEDHYKKEDDLQDKQATVKPPTKSIGPKISGLLQYSFDSFIGVRHILLSLFWGGTRLGQ